MATDDRAQGGVSSLTLLLGGARSGKSSLAVEMGMRHDGPVTYVATAAALDDDMAARIRRHRDERPPTWTTIEERVDLVGAIDASGAESLVIVDCLTLWTTNLLLDGHDDDEIRRLADESAAHAASSPCRIVAISNEVGLGIHPESELGRRFRDVLGWVNQSWARAADESLFLVAGRVLPLEDPWKRLSTRHNDWPT